MNAETDRAGELKLDVESCAPYPWLHGYDPGVPSTITVPNLALPHVLADTASRYPARRAIRFHGRAITYRELDQEVNRLANVLRTLGVGRGDRVGLLMPNSPQMVISFFGSLRVGAIVVCTSPLLSPVELRHVWKESDVRVVVCLSTLYRDVQSVRGDLTHLEHVVTTNIKEYLPPVAKILFTWTKESKEGHRPELVDDGRSHWLQPLLAAASPADPGVEIKTHDLALLQPTGGTTGLPKLAMLTHRNLLGNALQVSAWFSPLAKPDGSDVVLGVVPLFHIYGITTVMNYCALNGATMILQPRFVVRDVLRAIAKERVAFFPGVPAMYAAVNQAPAVSMCDFHSLKLAVSGAASLPAEVQSRFEALTGAKLVEGYGLTEAGPVTHCAPLLRPHKVGSIGLPLPSTAAALFDQETGTHMLPVGEIGELAVRGPQVMPGYWRQAEETSQVLRGKWLFTGDLARVDENGYFYVVDRKKDLIDTGGMKVYPRDVEEPLKGHPSVQDVVAVGVPDERWGEAVKVYIVLKEGRTATAAEIIVYCRDKMARYKVPKYVEFREELPKTVIGKVLRRQLLEEERAKLACAESRQSTGRSG